MLVAAALENFWGPIILACIAIIGAALERRHAKRVSRLDTANTMQHAGAQAERAEAVAGDRAFQAQMNANVEKLSADVTTVLVNVARVDQKIVDHIEHQH